MRTPFAYVALSLLSAAMFLACDKPAPERQPLQAVGFGVTGLAESRSAVLSAPAVTSLGIFGYTTGTAAFNPADATHQPNLFYNTPATRPEGGDWSYGAPVYWPADNAVKNTFFAYSPHQSTLSALPDAVRNEINMVVSGPLEAGYPTVSYTVPAYSLYQTDLLYATPVANVNKTTNNGSVVYQMQHATTWIAFLIAPRQKNDPREKYSLKSLAFSAINFTTRGTLNLGTGAWTGDANSTVLYGIHVDQTPIPVGSVVRAEANSSYLMLIPQTVTRADNDPMIYLSFTFDDGTGGEQDNSAYVFSVPFPEARTSSGGTGMLSAGRILTYVLQISVEGIAVKFASDNALEDWNPKVYPHVIEVY